MTGSTSRAKMVSSSLPTSITGPKTKVEPSAV